MVVCLECVLCLQAVDLFLLLLLDLQLHRLRSFLRSLDLGYFCSMFLCSLRRVVEGWRRRAEINTYLLNALPQDRHLALLGPSDVLCLSKSLLHLRLFLSELQGDRIMHAGI